MPSFRLSHFIVVDACGLSAARRSRRAADAERCVLCESQLVGVLDLAPRARMTTRMRSCPTVQRRTAGQQPKPRRRRDALVGGRLRALERHANKPRARRVRWQRARALLAPRPMPEGEASARARAAARALAQRAPPSAAGDAARARRCTSRSARSVMPPSNWVHFVRKARLFRSASAPTERRRRPRDHKPRALPAAAIDPDARRADVPRSHTHTHTRGTHTHTVHTHTHHTRRLHEMGHVKVAFLWELLSTADVLISDLDVVWLNDHWQRWMTWARGAVAPPVPRGGAHRDGRRPRHHRRARRGIRDAKGGRLPVGGGHTAGSTRASVDFRAAAARWPPPLGDGAGVAQGDACGKSADLNENVNDQSALQPGRRRR